MNILEGAYGRRYVEALIQKAFFYYNGKINTFNRSVELIISWASCRGGNEDVENARSYICGVHMLPNKIYIYPYEILKYTYDYSDHFVQSIFDCIVVTTIIHELHHADQMFHPYFSTTNDEYNRIMVEAPTRGMTYWYIRLHEQEISELFHIPVSIITYTLSKYEPYELVAAHRYKRKSLYSHIMMILEDKIQDINAIGSINHNMRNLYDNDNSSIIIEFNHWVLVIKSGVLITTVIEVNNFFSRFGDTHDLEMDAVMYANSTFILTFRGYTYDNMCEIKEVNKYGSDQNIT